VEERRLSAVALGKDDFIEEFDGRVVGAGAFSFVDEFVETCSSVSEVQSGV